jgi:hypothetical protein
MIFKKYKKIHIIVINHKCNGLIFTEPSLEILDQPKL